MVLACRMIKWLCDISVTAEESDNYFHFNDNRVLPEHVTAEIANAEVRATVEGRDVGL